MKNAGKNDKTELLPLDAMRPGVASLLGELVTRVRLFL